MRIEIPEFTRCCIFFPLRQSLMIWACIRVLLSIGLAVGLSLRWAGLPEYRDDFNPIPFLVDQAEWLCFFIIVAIVEIILGLVYIVGCLMKNVKLMNVYYHHCIGTMVLILLLCIYDIVWSIRFLYHIEYPLIDAAISVIQCTIITVSYAALQLYIILLIRSEIKKLTTGYDFRFENHVATAEETFNINQPNEEGYNKEKGDVEEIIQITSE